MTTRSLAWNQILFLEQLNLLSLQYLCPLETAIVMNLTLSQTTIIATNCCLLAQL